MADKMPLTFDEFRSFLAETLAVEEDDLKPETSFLNDLAIESLKLVELMLQMELKLGVSVPAEVAWEIQTVGDAYNYYSNNHYLAEYQDEVQEEEQPPAEAM